MHKHLLSIILLIGLGLLSKAQTFPNPATLSTGQGTPGTLDPIWTVSPWYTNNPPNPIGLTYNPALINNNCAPGAWVNPAALPPPVNNGNWITGNDGLGNCGNNPFDGYRYFRLTLNLPADCNGNSVAATGNYELYFNGYADNTIANIYVNGTATGISGGNFTSPLSITLTGPWVAGINYVDVLVHNFPGGSDNPYGLLLVANSNASSNNDLDSDGVSDLNDQCPCLAGNMSNGCAPVSISGDTIICNGESTTLAANGFGNYVWNTGATTQTITVNPTVTTRYSVTSTLSNGYTDSAFVFVRVNQLPNAAISPQPIAICAGGSTTLTASGGTSYLWNTSAATPAITVSPTNTTSYTVTVTDANGCSNSATGSVTVNSLPTPSITPATSTICAGQSATLTASGGTGYLWNTTEATATITVTPANTTSYTVTVTDANNCTATTSATVNVNALPVATINPSSTAICAGQSATLTASGGTSYLWSTTDATPLVTVSPTNITSYSVTVTDANNCTATTSATVNVNALPVAAINPSSTAICTGQSASLTASGGTSYLWSTTDATAAITVTPTNTTTYTVTVTDANNCTASSSAAVTVNALPTAAITPASTAICTGSTATLTASGGTAYLWSTNAVTAAITESPANNNSYTVTVTDANNCTDTASAFVVVNPLPTATISADTTICAGGTAVITAGGGTTYTWNNNATGSTISILPTSNTSFSVTVSDANNCTDVASANVTVVPQMALNTTVNNVSCFGNNNGSIDLAVNSGAPPYNYLWSNNSTNQNLASLAPGTYDVTVSDSEGCTVTTNASVTEPALLSLTSSYTDPSCESIAADGTITLNVSGGTTPYNFFWSHSSTSQNQSGLLPGVYNVTVSDNNNCSANTTFTLTYQYDFSVTAQGLEEVSLGAYSTLSYNITGNAGTYQALWSPANLVSCNLCDSTLTATNVTATYQVEITNQIGCTATDTITVTVLPDYRMFVPNLFTPNNDGNNDYFKVLGNIKGLKFFSLKVFNRLGEKVFESEDINVGWDGTYKGVSQESGVYTWQMQTLFIDGKRDNMRKGSVTLIK